MPEWKLISLNAEGGDKQQAGSLFKAHSSRKFCGGETICFLAGQAWWAPTSVGFLPSSDSAWNPVQWSMFVTAEEAPNPWGWKPSGMATAVSHRHCCVDACHTGQPVLLNLQERALACLWSLMSYQRSDSTCTPLCINHWGITVCLHWVRIVLLHYRSHAKDSVQGSLEPQASKAGEISVVATLGERKPTCS